MNRISAVLGASLVLCVGLAYSVARAEVDGEPSKTMENSIGMKLILIAPGKFTMGSPALETGRNRNEAQVEVTLTKSFYLAGTVVTQGQWNLLMSTEPWKGKTHVKEGANYPATYVSWEDSKEFCKALSAKEGKQYRLPTEAEWEYACRAGTTTAYSFGDEASLLREYGWWGGFTEGSAKGEQYAHEVATKKPNPWGFFDMHGNVWQWCEDRYEFQLPGGSDPLVTSGGESRVYRGGSWDDGSVYCRSAFRDGYLPSIRRDSFGFRVVLVPSPK